MSNELNLKKEYDKKIGELIIRHAKLQKLKEQIDDQLCMKKEDEQIISNPSLAFQRKYLEEVINSLNEFINICQAKPITASNTVCLNANVQKMITVIDDVFFSDKTLPARFKAISTAEYQASRWEYLLAYTVKVIKTILAAAFGFFMGLLMGAIFTGGMASIPAAIYLSIKSAAAYWGSTQVVSSIGPALFAGMLAYQTIQTKTYSAIEYSMVDVRQRLQAYNSYAYFADLYNKVNAIEDAKIQHEAREFLKKCIDRASMLYKESNSTFFFKGTRREKAFILCMAIESVIDKIPEQNGCLSKEQLLSLELKSEHYRTLADALNKPRYPHLDKLLIRSDSYQTKSYQLTLS